MSTEAYRAEIKTKIISGAWGLFIGTFIAIIIGFKFWGLIIAALIAMSIGFKWSDWTGTGYQKEKTKA